jgi:hypothetical protein
MRHGRLGIINWADGLAILTCHVQILLSRYAFGDDTIGSQGFIAAVTRTAGPRPLGQVVGRAFETGTAPT